MGIQTTISSKNAMYRGHAAFAAMGVSRSHGYGSPHFLLGLSSDLANKMKFDMIEHWCPDTYADMEMVAELERVIPGYERLEREIGSTWFSPALAAQADTRVDISG